MVTMLVLWSLVGYFGTRFQDATVLEGEWFERWDTFALGYRNVAQPLQSVFSPLDVAQSFSW